MAIAGADRKRADIRGGRRAWAVLDINPAFPNNLGGLVHEGPDLILEHR